MNFKLSFHTWGNNFLAIYAIVHKNQNQSIGRILYIIRDAKDPFLVHRYHDKNCEPLKTAEDQYNACKKTEASHRMPISFLNQTVLEFLATKRI